MIALIKKLIGKLKKTPKKEIKPELQIEKYIKQNIQTSKENDSFEVLKINLKNSSKDLYDMSNFKDYSINLWDISEQASRPLLVMIMGEFKTGKSTFINAMLEEEILKSDVTPATAVVSMISYGEKKKVLAHLRDNSTKEYSFEELASITAEGDDSKKELRSNIKYVELFMPKEILKNITIIDTPGLNVDNELHIQATKEFMDEADMVFWVFAYGKAASRTEVAAISELSKRLKPVAIVNRIDEIDEEEESVEDIIEEIKKRLKGHVENIIGVSSFLAKKGILENDSRALKESRWNIFTEKLEKEVLEKSEILKVESVFDKLNEFVHKLKEQIKENKEDLKKLEEKFTNSAEYKKGLKEDIKYLKELIAESESMRKNRETITVDSKYLYECWGNNRSAELEKITIPLNYLLKIEGVLKLIKGTEKIISNIQSYNSIYENIGEEIEKINATVQQLNRIHTQMSEELKQYNAKVNDYNHSGFFGGAPLFDWNGKGKELEKWRVDYNSRLEALQGKYRRCESDRAIQFSKITRMNAEIYDYLPKISKVFNANIKQGEVEIKNFDTSFKAEEQKYNLLKIEVFKADKVAGDLEQLLIKNNKVNLAMSEVAVAEQSNKNSNISDY